MHNGRERIEPYESNYYGAQDPDLEEDEAFHHHQPEGDEDDQGADMEQDETSSFLSPLRYDNTDRFVVLRDWRKSFNAANAWATAAGTDSLSIQEPFDEYVKLPNLQTVYSGQSSPQTITDISSGALYFICRADTGGGATGLFQARINAGSFCRLRYIE